ncbi:MAG: hypothetical protein ACT4PZ_15035 [Panacagrimonas sp.]
MSRFWAEGLRPVLMLDLRSLALLRVGLALVLLLDALCRFGSAGSLYADTGLLPRADALSLIEPGRLSLHFVNGSVLFAGLLCIAQILAAAALLVGWRVRTASLLCWLLAVSASARNPLVVTPGDAYAIALLTWGLFLPWGMRWSVDGARSRIEPPPNEHFSPAGVVLLLQVLALPLLNVLATPDGYLASESGRSSAQVFVRAAVGWVEILVLPLALVPFFGAVPRRLALTVFVLLGLLAFAARSPGALPWLALCSGAVLIDGGLWARMGRSSASGALKIYLDRDDLDGRHALQTVLEFLCLSATPLLPAQDSARTSRLTQAGSRLVVIDANDSAHLDGEALHRILTGSPLLRPLRAVLASPSMVPVCARMLQLLLRPRAATAVLHEPHAVFGRHIGVQAVAVVLGALSLVWQLGAVGVLPSSAQTIAAEPLQPLGLDRAWTWFAPGPNRKEHWIAVPGERTDGRLIDALARPGQADRGPNFGREQAPMLEGLRGSYYEQRLAFPANGAARAALARQLCARHGAPLARVRVVLVTQASTDAAAEQHVLSRHECAPAGS